MDKFPASRRATNIEYAIRDVVVPARELEKQGKKILKLNIGDPLAYHGFPTPNHMIEAFYKGLKEQQNGYSPSYGLPELREAISYDESQKVNGGWDCKSDDVYVCHGVTEALQIIFAAFLQQDDKVLAPGPHYPPYMAYPQLFGGQTVEYSLDEENGWSIDLEDLESKMDDKVRLIVVINPNNPTGGIADKNHLKKIIDIAGKWPHCAVISDEIYDKINFKGNHYSTASLSDNVPVITLNGVSKVYYAPGWRIGYMAWHDPEEKLSLVRDGAERLLRSRLCASTPAQLGYLAGLQSNKCWMNDYTNRLLEQRDLCIKRVQSIDGLKVTKPEGAFYMFIRITDDQWKSNDKGFVLKLLKEQHLLLVHGSGFSHKYGQGHFRIVFLPSPKILNEAFDRINRFLTVRR